MKYLSTLLIIILLTFSMLVQPLTSAIAGPVNLMPNVSSTMMDPAYWIGKLPDPDRIIMNPQEIEAFNQRIIKSQPGMVFDLTEAPEAFTGSDLIRYINQPMPEGKTYIGKQEVKPEYYAQLIKLVNLTAIKEINPVQYAVSIERTNLKVFPTLDVISDEYDDPEYDLLQVSAVLPNEAVLILHRSLDGKWYFARINNCQGWLPATSVAVCPEREVWEHYQKTHSFLTITGNRIRLCTNYISPELSEKEFTMGCKLPLANPGEIPTLVDRQNPTGNYVVKLPVRDACGQLEFKLALVPVSSDVCEGYLPYTRANIILQAFKLQGEKYGWGGMLNARDCSSMVMEIYRCFGVRLPRNSAQQAATAGRTLTLKGFDTETREELLNDLSPGAILHFSGHIMLYLGEANDRHYVISDLGSYAIPKPDGTMETVRVHGVVVNDLSLMRRNGNRWIDELTVGKEVENSWFDDLEGHWARLSIMELADRFVVRGRQDGSFDPGGYITRAELATMVSRALNLPPPKGDNQSFSDISGQWYTDWVEAAAGAGYVKGKNQGIFCPANPCTRFELACILARVLEKSGVMTVTDPGILDRFADKGQIPEWARGAVVTLVKQGIMVGDKDLLRPGQAVTRAEAAVLIDRTLDVMRTATDS